MKQKNQLKQRMVPKPDTKLSHKFNRQHAQAIEMLSWNIDELFMYLKEQSYNNPYLKANIQDTSVYENALAFQSNERTLHDEVFEQISYSNEILDTSLCEFMMMNLDSNGYFTCTYDELIKQSRTNKEEIDHHLQILRTFEPFGVFAFSLQECLQLQCKANDNPIASLAYDVCNYLEDVALQKWNTIADTLSCSVDEVQKAVTFIRSLNPKPAANYSTVAIYSRPEFVITVNDDEIHIEPIDEQKNLQLDLHSLDASNEAMKTMLQDARNIINNYQRRSLTLLQMMNCITDIQKGFFLNNDPIQPCTLSVVANRCQLSISTISRALSNKTFEFQNRYYQMKDFISCKGKDGYSQNEVISIIKKYIALEDPMQPLSDSSLSKLLKDNYNLDISRRTIAKYRDIAHIFNSTQRKRS